MFDGLGQTKPTIKAKVSEVLRAVAAYANVTVAELQSPCRKAVYARPRQVAAYLCRELTDLSYPAIGRLIGGRDHTTILFAHRKIAAMVADDRPGVVMMLDSLKATILAEAAVRHAREEEARKAVPITETEYPRNVFADKTDRTHWTPAQLNELKRLRDLGLSRSQIAERMRRSVCAIAHKVAELKLAPLHRHHLKDVTAWMEVAA